MATNIEIKARVKGFDQLKERVEQISDTAVEVIPQKDTFFHVPQGRLKLRVLAPDRGQLVYYERPDMAGPKTSNYFIYSTSDPKTLETILAVSLGVRGIVSKERHLYLVGHTRIHLDKVDSLGNFLELEVVLSEEQSPPEGEAIATELMRRLGIDAADLVEGAYLDLLELKEN
ncbi:MAG: class IV adenylate cyclase [Anaerolineae bacterium]|nr:class IV adenylate cyclase [Anaerolineae bacterium]